jgi:Fic family protein
MFVPVFRITAAITKALMAIEADRQAVAGLPIDVTMLASLRQTARLAAVHYSTQIEGNRLTQEQVREVLDGARFPGRRRDEIEVRNYYRALEEVERLAGNPRPPTELAIRRLHGLVMKGRAAPTPYRDGQNVIRDSRSGGIVYLPPEAGDVPALMAELAMWIKTQMGGDDLPMPLVAALAHYQFATIHPYYDGNGRTARLLATLILHKTGYGLKGIYALEEYYAANLAGYYRALQTHRSHNYYMGRQQADLTGFLGYFCNGMAEAFHAVRAQAARAAQRGASDQSPILRRLDPRERRLLEMFRGQGTASTHEIAAHLRLSPRTTVALCRQWVVKGLLLLHDPSRKNRSYRLAPAYERLIP